MPHRRRPDPTTRKPRHDPNPRPSVPEDSYLLITTPAAVYTWTPSGLCTIFRSSKYAIRAAKISTDGTDVLAVATGSVVVLHDCKRRREESWGLDRSDGGRKGMLEYAADGKRLLFETVADGRVRCFDLEKREMLGAVGSHRLGRVLAVDGMGTLIVGVSKQEGMVFFQDVETGMVLGAFSLGGQGARPVVAAFHPERHGVFLVGCADGTLATFDATNLLAAGHEDSVVINSLPRLHTANDPATPSAGVLAATVLQGHTMRTVSIDEGGQCKTVDFSGPPSILRTWSIPQYASSLAAITCRRRLDDMDGQVIAIGFADGKIRLYDDHGQELHIIKLDISSEVLDVDWIHGVVPAAIEDSDLVPRHSMLYENVKMTDTEEDGANWVPLVQKYQSCVMEARGHERRTALHRQSAAPSPRVAPLKGPPQTPEDDLGTVIIKQTSSNDKDVAPITVSPLSGLFDSGKDRPKSVIIRHSHSPERPRLPSKFLKWASDVEAFSDVSRQEIRPGLDWSEPPELDPNIALSYLTGPESQQPAGRKGFKRRNTVFMVTPDWQFSSSEEESSRSEYSDTKDYSQRSFSKSLQQPTFVLHMNRTATSNLRKGPRKVSAKKLKKAGSTIWKAPPIWSQDGQKRITVEPEPRVSPRKSTLKELVHTEPPPKPGRTGLLEMLSKGRGTNCFKSAPRSGRGLYNNDRSRTAQAPCESEPQLPPTELIGCPDQPPNQTLLRPSDLEPTPTSEEAYITAKELQSPVSDLEVPGSYYPSSSVIRRQYPRGSSLALSRHAASGAHKPPHRPHHKSPRRTKFVEGQMDGTAGYGNDDTADRSKGDAVDASPSCECCIMLKGKVQSLKRQIVGMRVDIDSRWIGAFHWPSYEKLACSE